MTNHKRQWDKRHSKAFLRTTTKEESVKLPLPEEVVEVPARQDQSHEHDLMTNNKSLYDDGDKMQVPDLNTATYCFQHRDSSNNRLA